MNRRNVVSLALCLVLLFIAAPASYAAGVDFFMGTSFHTSIPVQIGQYRIDDPEWETRPFGDAKYYSLRIRWGGHEIEFIHDKVYLAEDTPNIQDFSISDGYNFLLYNVPEKWGPVEVRIGMGIIIAHPEGTVDGYNIGSLGSPSWRVGGLGGQLAAGYRGKLWEGLSWMAEAKVTTGFVHATYPEPVHQINVPASGWHILLGVGYDL